MSQRRVRPEREASARPSSCSGPRADGVPAGTVTSIAAVAASGCGARNASQRPSCSSFFAASTSAAICLSFAISAASSMRSALRLAVPALRRGDLELARAPRADRSSDRTARTSARRGAAAGSCRRIARDDRRRRRLERELHRVLQHAAGRALGAGGHLDLVGRRLREPDVGIEQHRARADPPPLALRRRRQLDRAWSPRRRSATSPRPSAG